MHIKTLVGVHSYVLISITDRADGVSCFEHKISLQLDMSAFRPLPARQFCFVFLLTNLSLCMKAFENVALRQLRWGLVRGCGMGDGMGWVNAPKAFAKAKAALTYKPDSIQSTPTLLLTFDIGVYELSLHRISRSVDFECDLIAIVPVQLRENYFKTTQRIFSVK